MRDKLESYALKFGLVLFFLVVVMLCFQTPGTAEWVILWISFAILFVFDSILIGIINYKARKEKHEKK